MTACTNADCRNDNPPSATFCARCGAPLGASTIGNGPRRPRSLAIISLLALFFFGGGYVLALGMLVSGISSLTFQRLIVEPPESEGGIPWPGWDTIGRMLRHELPPLSLDNLSGTVVVVHAEYWWSKINMAGSLLIGPVLIVGWLGVYLGRTWGRILLYVYLGAWLSDKVIYLILMGAEGVFKFSIAVGMTVLLVLLLRSRSWAAWIEQRPLAITTQAGASEP